MTVDRTNLLKIDKDVFVDRNWIQGYVETIIQICRMHGIEVTCIKMCPSKKKGSHFYITVNPEVDAQQANYLQWILGDDARRVDFNRARIDSGLDEWNKLFEVGGRRLKAIYRADDS